MRQEAACFLFFLSIEDDVALGDLWRKGIAAEDLHGAEGRETRSLTSSWACCLHQAASKSCCKPAPLVISLSANCSPCELGLYLNISAWFNAAQPHRVEGAEGSSGRLSELLLALICALLHSSQIPRAPWRCERGRECSNSTSSG